MSRKGPSRGGSESPMSLPHVQNHRLRCHNCNKSLDGQSVYGFEPMDASSIKSGAIQKRSVDVKMPPVPPIKKAVEDPEGLPHAHTTSGPCYFCSEHKDDYEKIERYQPTWRAKHADSEEEEEDYEVEVLDHSRLTAVLEETEKKNLQIKSDLKKLEGTKKEKDAKSLMDTIYNQLDDHVKMHQQTEKEMDELKEELRKRLGKPAPKKDDDTPSAPPGRRPMASPEEQVLTYELKSQLLRNVEMQNHRLKTELTLHEKMTEAKLLNQQNKRLHDDNASSKTNTLRLMKMFEKKAKDADSKLKEMQQELNKAQQLARKYHQMYDMERRRNGAPEGAHGTPEPEYGTPRQNNSSSSFLGQNVRVNDVIRKNEVLLEENEKLHREIARIKHDNANLIKKCKHAMSDKDGLIHRLDTSEANRRELSKRLDREKTQHQNLSKSLTRQASDWILLKKQLAQFDEEYRWSQIKQQCEEGKQRFGLLPPIYYYIPMEEGGGNSEMEIDDDDREYQLPQDKETCLTPITEVGPVNPHGADQRTYSHPVPKNIYQPRRMFSPENYANQSTA